MRGTQHGEILKKKKINAKTAGWELVFSFLNVEGVIGFCTGF